MKRISRSIAEIFSKQKRSALLEPALGTRKCLRLFALGISFYCAGILCSPDTAWAGPKPDAPTDFKELVRFVAGAPTPVTVIPASRNEIWSWSERHKMLVDRARRGNVGLLFLGDSITEAMLSHRDLLNKYFGSMKPVPFGIGGDRTEHLIWRIQNGELDGISPKVLVLLIGTNNISAGDHDVDIVRGVQAVVKEIHSRLPKTKIVLLGLLPRDAEPGRIRKHISFINASLPKLADKKTVWFIDVGDKFLDQKGNLPADLMPDYLHPSSRGYEVMFEQIKPLVEKLYNSP